MCRWLRRLRPDPKHAVHRHQDSFYIKDEHPRTASGEDINGQGDRYCPFATCLVYVDTTADGAAATKVAVGSHKHGAGLHGGLWREQTARHNYAGGIVNEALEGYEVACPEMAVGDALVVHGHVVSPRPSCNACC